MNEVNLNNVSDTIRIYRACIKGGESYECGLLVNLINAWNWATSPVRLRTDREHDACRHFARIIRKRLDNMSGWKESKSGYLWTV